MSTCTKWFYAEDAEGKSLPFAARFEFYELKDNKFVDSGIYGILSGSSHTLSLDSRKRYKIVPLDKVVQNGKLITLSGWIIPNTVEFTGCLEDITLVYKKIICTPSSTKCVGNAVHKCNSDGTEWKFLKDCPGGCKDGECLELPIMVPVISSIGTKETPKICEPVKFESKFDYNDDGWQKTDIGTGLRRAWWEYSTDDKEWTSECADELDWVQFSDASWPTYTFIEEHVDIRHIRHTIENKYGERACAIIDNFRFEDANGFVITVDPVLNGKKMIVYHVTPIVGTDLYYFPFSYVGGGWNSISADTVYKVPIGNISSTPKPAFDKIMNTGSFADGIDCVVLVESSDMVGFNIFKKEDVFKLRSDVPNCIDLKTASNDVLTEAIMGPVCDLFKIPRGDECESFWVEFYDPVFIANYASILKTGKDTLGNTRELTAFDHLALPFAVIGVIAPQFPFGKFVSKGSEVLWTGGKQISDAAFNWMKTVVLKAPGEIIEKDVLTFMESIVRLSGDHIDEVLELMVAGKFDAAKLKINEYLPIDFGSIPFRRYAEFNDALREHLTQEQFEQLMSLIHGFGPQIDSVIKTASKTDLTVSDIDDLVEAAKELKVIDEATAVVYKSIENLESASKSERSKLFNILLNSNDIHKVINDRYHTILWDIGLGGGGDITSNEIRMILNHVDLMTDDISYLVTERLTPILRDDIIKKLSGDTYRNVMANFIDTVGKHYDTVLGGGTPEELKHARQWMKETSELSRKALDSADPAKMADIPHAAQNIAAKQDDIIEDYCGGHPASCIDDTNDLIFGSGRTVVDEIVDTTNEFANETVDNWITKGKTYTKERYDRIWSWYSTLSKKNKERAVHALMAASMFFIAVLLYAIYKFTDDDVSPAYELKSNIIEESYWVCKDACDKKLYDELEAAIVIFRKDVTNAEEWLEDNKEALEGEETYEEFSRNVELRKIQLELFEECLSGDIGTIRCTSNQPGFHVFIDDESKGHAYTSKLMVIKNVKAGSHKVKIEKGSGYTPTYCEETVTVTEGGTVTVDCQMTKIEECSEVTNVKIYIDPLSPLEGDTVAINGSADSYDPIEESGWKWDFGDKSTKDTGQAVTHVYSKAEAYTVRLTVTNDCGISAISTRVITVKEEDEPVVKESCTLLVKEPIDSITGKKCTRSYNAEIYVDGNTIGKKTQFSIPFGTNDKIGGYGGQCGESHVIKIVLDGYDDTEKSFTIKADDSKEWQPEMTKTVAAKETGFIDCKTTPTDAEIFIDGVYYGNTDKKIEISSGDSWVVFKAEGYEDCDAPVTVVKGETVTAECVMVATKLYEVDITVPVGATLFVDGKEIEMTQVSRLSTILRDIRR